MIEFLQLWVLLTLIINFHGSYHEKLRKMPRVNLNSTVVQRKNHALQVVIVVILPLTMVNPSFASNVANPATRKLIVPQGRRGMVVLQMGQLIAHQLHLIPRKLTISLQPFGCHPL
jgi:hypothetical protein